MVRSEFKLLFCFHQLADNGNQPLQREEIHKLLCALETKLPTEIAKAVMLLPSVKASMKYHFLEEIDQQCRDLCVRKHAPSVLHVCRNETKSSLESFTWSSVLQEMKERAPDVLDFIATISVPVVKEKENQVPPLCVSYGLMMHTRWKELSLIQKIVTFILGIGHSTAKVNFFWKLNEQNKYHSEDHLQCDYSNQGHPTKSSTNLSNKNRGG